MKHLLGPDAPGLSSTTISRLKRNWEEDYQNWSRRDLSGKRYVYVWADGIYSTVRMDDRLCLLTIIGSDEMGRKELLALSDGYRESEASWTEVLMDLKQRGLKEALHNIWQAETREKANAAFDNCIERFSPKYPKAMECLAKDKDSMLAFYDYPAENWQHIRTINPVESVFATVRLRTAKTKNCGNRTTTLTMAFKLMEVAQKKWFRLRGYKLLADVIQGIKFVNGVKQNGDQKQRTA